MLHEGVLVGSHGEEERAEICRFGRVRFSILNAALKPSFFQL